MNKNGPIIVIEDDIDDREIMEIVFDELDFGNELIFFPDGEKALTYLNESIIEPFIILSDINLPRLSGLELRKKIHQNEDLRLKTIPYLFFTTAAEQKYVVDAYSTSVQGFFVKPNDFKEVKETMKVIIDYWKKCRSPNYVKQGV